MGSVLKLPPGIGRKRKVVNVKRLKDVGTPAPSGHFTIDEVQKAFAEVMDQSSLDALIREAVGEVIEKAMPSQDLDAKLSEMESEGSVESEVIKAEGGEGGDLPEAPGGGDEEEGDDDPEEVVKALTAAEFHLEMGDFEEVEKALGGIKKYIKRWKEKGVWRYLYPGKKGGERSKKAESEGGEGKPSGDSKETGKPAPGVTPEYTKKSKAEAASMSEKYSDKGKVEFRDGSDGNKFGYYFTPRGTDESVRIGGSSPTEAHAYLREFSQPNSKGRAQQRDAFEKTKELKESMGLKGEIKYEHEGDDAGFYFHPEGKDHSVFMHESDLDAGVEKLKKNLEAGTNRVKELQASAKSLNEKVKHGKVEFREASEGGKEGFYFTGKDGGEAKRIGSTASDATISLRNAHVLDWNS